MSAEKRTYRARRQRAKKAQRVMTELGVEKICPRCGESWPEDAEFFYRYKGKLHSWCIACYREYRAQKYLDKHPNSNNWLARSRA